MFGRESQNDRSFLVAENGSRDQPDDGALSEGKNIFGQSYPPTSPLREVDSYYANCQSAPLRSTRYAFGNDLRKINFFGSLNTCQKRANGLRTAILDRQLRWTMGLISILHS